MTVSCAQRTNSTWREDFAMSVTYPLKKARDRIPPPASSANMLQVHVAEYRRFEMSVNGGRSIWFSPGEWGS
jgi:hypothetical protein